MDSTITINGRRISPNDPPYVIAELSANHNGSIENALALIGHAKTIGADAIKLQTYRPDTITLNSNSPEFFIDDGLWRGRTLYDLYQETHTPWEWHPQLFDCARKADITIFSSPFDATAIDFLEDLGAPAYKIASFEAIDLPLIRYAASTGKPMIVSTGMADKDEISEAVEAAKSAGCSELVLLHCVSGYPAPAADYNLATLPDMAKQFCTPVGLSDHTLSSTTAIASVTMGACVIEKHFTLDRSRGGADDSFSLEPAEFKLLIEQVSEAWMALGKIDYGRKSSEVSNIKFRRSLYFVQDIRKGDIISAAEVRSVRPGYGVPPKYLEDILGTKAKRDISACTPVLATDLTKK